MEFPEKRKKILTNDGIPGEEEENMTDKHDTTGERL
jgi:hypothetical protein